MRMPDYGLSPAEATALARYFAVLAGVRPEETPFAPAADDTLALGRRRFAHFKCMQCHPASGDPGPCTVDVEDLSIDLRLVQVRLRPAWVRDFLARPKSIVGSETRMPAVFYTTDGFPKVEHPEDDIAALTAYLFQMSEAGPASATGDGVHERTPEPSIDWRTYPY
jgi:hypothetical protein